jgi:hypothetical protein
MALQHNLSIDAGATYQISFPVRDAAGTPADVTGLTARAQIRRSPGDAVLLYDFATPPNGIVVSTDDRTVTLTVPAATSSAWDFTLGVYSVELADPAANPETVWRLAEGRVSVSPETTR